MQVLDGCDDDDDDGEHEDKHEDNKEVGSLKDRPLHLVENISMGQYNSLVIFEKLLTVCMYV